MTEKVKKFYVVTPCGLKVPYDFKYDPNKHIIVCLPGTGGLGYVCDRETLYQLTPIIWIEDCFREDCKHYPWTCYER